MIQLAQWCIKKGISGVAPVEKSEVPELTGWLRDTVFKICLFAVYLELDENLLHLCADNDRSRMYIAGLDWT